MQSTNHKSRLAQASSGAKIKRSLSGISHVETSKAGRLKLFYWPSERILKKVRMLKKSLRLGGLPPNFYPCRLLVFSSVSGLGPKLHGNRTGPAPGQNNGGDSRAGGPRTRKGVPWRKDRRERQDGVKLRSATKVRPQPPTSSQNCRPLFGDRTFFRVSYQKQFDVLTAAAFVQLCRCPVQ